MKKRTSIATWWRENWVIVAFGIYISFMFFWIGGE